MELFNLSFLNSFCCNSLVHLMFDTKQKHWKQYTTDLNLIQSLVYVSLCFNFFRLHNLLDFDTAIMRFGFPYHAFTWQSLSRTHTLCSSFFFILFLNGHSHFLVLFDLDLAATLDFPSHSLSLSSKILKLLTS